MAVIFERYDSRETTISVENPAATLRLFVDGTENEFEVHALVQAFIPSFYIGLVFQEYRITPQGDGLWDVEARYGRRTPEGFSPPSTGGPGSEGGGEGAGGGEGQLLSPTPSTVNFDTTGGSAHITQSITQAYSAARPGKTAPDFKGAIGVQGESVEGVDVVRPVFNYQETHYFPPGKLPPEYLALLFHMTGKINNTRWRNFEAGELLFLGGHGSARGQEDVEIVYKFLGVPNAQNIEIGDGIVVATKLGHDYLWIRYEDVEDQGAKALVKRPSSAHVEVVYEGADFNLLGIGP